MISMAWENTLLASRILPPAYTPVEVATNRSQDASLMLDQDGRLTLLIILTTSAGLAIVLLFFIFLRIGCLRGQSCFGRYKDRHDRSAFPLTTVVLDDHAAITKSQATSPQAIQTTFIQTRNDPPNDSYIIKLVDNDLIVETQVLSGSGEPATATSTAMETMTPTATLKMFNPPGEVFSQQHRQSDNNASQQLKLSSSGEAGEVQSGFLIFKTWLSGMKSKDLPTENGTAYIGSLAREDVQLQQQQQMATPLETKSLCGSPKRRYGRPLANGEAIATQKQQILARFGQHLPGFGFTQSKSSCLFEDDDDEEYELDELSSAPAVTYSYRNGNQFEYMGGPYGYVDPLYSHQLPGNNNQHPAREMKSFGNERNRTSVRLEELDIVQRAGQRNSMLESRQEPQPPVLLLLPTLVRSADSLVLPTK